MPIDLPSLRILTSTPPISSRSFGDLNPTNNAGNSIYFWEEGMAGPMLLPAERYHETFLCDADQAAFKIRFYIRENALYS